MSPLEQGDIIEVDFTPAVGHKPAKRRPAIVVSCFAFNARSSVVAVVPITSKNNGHPFHVPVRAGDASGFACVEGIRSLDVAQRGYRFVGYANDEAMWHIMTCIRGMLDLK